MKKFKNFKSDEALNRYITEIVAECKSSYPLMPNVVMPTAVDIGANVGGFGVIAHKHFDKIYAFEPVVENYHVAMQVMEEADISNVEIYNMAVHSESGKNLPLQLGSCGSSGGVTCLDLPEHNFAQIGQTCETISLDHILERLDLDMIHYLKMDCEGSEYEILENFQNFDKVLFLAMEVHGYYSPERKLALLEKLGDEFYLIPHARGLLSLDADMSEYCLNGKQEELQDLENVFALNKRFKEYLKRPDIKRVDTTLTSAHQVLSTKFPNLSSHHAIYEWLTESLAECAASYPLSKSPQGVAIDIGANVGGFPVHAHSVFKKIYALEPLKEHCDLMRGLLEELKIDNVEIIQKAVTGQSGDTLQLRVHDDHHSKDITCANFENESFIDIGETCQTISLKDIFTLTGEDRISYLKVDCEGSEYEIFENFDEYDKIDLIAMEIHTFYGQPRKMQLLKKIKKTHHLIGLGKASEVLLRGDRPPVDFGNESEVIKASHSLEELAEEHNIFCVIHKWEANAYAP